MPKLEIPQKLLAGMQIIISYYADFFRRRYAEYIADEDRADRTIHPDEWPDENGMRQALRRDFPGADIAIVSVEGQLSQSKFDWIDQHSLDAFEINFEFDDALGPELKALADDVDGFRAQLTEAVWEAVAEFCR